MQEHLFARKKLQFMVNTSNNMLTLCLLGGANNTIACLKEINKNYGKESLRG